MSRGMGREDWGSGRRTHKSPRIFLRLWRVPILKAGTGANAGVRSLMGMLPGWRTGAGRMPALQKGIGAAPARFGR